MFSPKKTMIGERSIPTAPKRTGGSKARSGASTGSVALNKNRVTEPIRPSPVPGNHDNTIRPSRINKYSCSKKQMICTAAQNVGTKEASGERGDSVENEAGSNELGSGVVQATLLEPTAFLGRDLHIGRCQ